MRAPAAFVALLLLVLPAVAGSHARADAGSSDDAPDAWEAAWDVPLGAFSGSLDPAAGDEVDWYRLPFPEGKILEWRIHSPMRNVRMTFLDGDGAHIVSVSYWQFGSGNASWSFRSIVPPGSSVHVGVQSEEGSSGPYLVEARARDWSDVSVDALAVTTKPAPTDAVAEEPLNRYVHVNVSNVGAEPTTAYVSATAIATSTGSSRHLGGREVFLASGERVTLTFRWNGLGQAGETRIQAEAQSYWRDARADNNQLATTANVLVNGNGVGVDALNGGAGIGLAGAYWGSDGRGFAGACAYAPLAHPCLQAPLADVDAHPAEDAEGDSLAVSGTGTARSGGVALSGTGNAHGEVAGSATGDSEGVYALSGTGNATGFLSLTAFGTARGFAPVSLFGDANGTTATSGTGSARGIVATSGTGDANGDFLAVSGTGNASCGSEICLAASGTGVVVGGAPLGGSQCNGGRCVQIEPHDDARSTFVAASGEGNSSGPVALSGLGDASGPLVAASGTGDAGSPTPTLGAAASGTGDASGGRSASGTGDARCAGLSCFAVSGTGDAHATCERAGFLPVPCLALSLTGDAECADGRGEFHDSCVALGVTRAMPPATVNPTGDAEGGDVAVSGTGDARTDRGASVSATGDATNGRQDDGSCARDDVHDISCIAISGTGNATNGGRGAGSCADDDTVAAIGCVAVSGAGAASNAGDGEAACRTRSNVFGAGNVNCVAVSGTGDATNAGEGRDACASEAMTGVTCLAASGTGAARNAGSGEGACRQVLPTVSCVAVSGDAPPDAPSAWTRLVQLVVENPFARWVGSLAG